MKNHFILYAIISLVLFFISCKKDKVEYHSSAFTTQTNYDSLIQFFKKYNYNTPSTYTFNNQTGTTIVYPSNTATLTLAPNSVSVQSTYSPSIIMPHYGMVKLSTYLYSKPSQLVLDLFTMLTTDSSLVSFQDMLYLKYQIPDSTTIDTSVAIDANKILTIKKNQVNANAVFLKQSNNALATLSSTINYTINYLTNPMNITIKRYNNFSDLILIGKKQNVSSYFSTQINLSNTNTNFNENIETYLFLFYPSVYSIITFNINKYPTYFLSHLPEIYPIKILVIGLGKISKSLYYGEYSLYNPSYNIHISLYPMSESEILSQLNAL